MKHIVRVKPNSRAERRLVSLLSKAFKSTNEEWSVQLGALFGTPYNSYIFSDAIYQRIKEKLK